LVQWPLVALLVAGGLAGAVLGLAGARHLAARRGFVERGFALLVIAVGIYVAVMR
jgi:uncharacterized membrane protein YfcA